MERMSTSARSRSANSQPAWPVASGIGDRRIVRYRRHRVLAPAPASGSARPAEPAQQSTDRRRDRRGIVGRLWPRSRTRIWAALSQPLAGGADRARHPAQRVGCGSALLLEGRKRAFYALMPALTNQLDLLGDLTVPVDDLSQAIHARIDLAEYRRGLNDGSGAVLLKLPKEFALPIKEVPRSLSDGGDLAERLRHRIVGVGECPLGRPVPPRPGARPRCSAARGR